MDNALEVTKKPTPTAILRETVAKQAGELMSMRENMAALKLAIEDRGWSRIGNQYDADGMDLESVKLMAKDLRSWVVGGGIMKKIIELRGNTIYGSGVGFTNFTKAKKAFESPNNVNKLFSMEALLEINRAHGTDGQVVFLVKKSTKEIIRLTLEQVSDLFMDPDDRERVLYVRRTYKRITTDNPQGVDVDEYYIADTCTAEGKTKDAVKVSSGETVPINKDYDAFTWDVNRQVGWPVGIPDLFASLQWAEKYTAYLKDQSRFAEALASIAWQYKGATVDQAKKMAATIATSSIGKTVAGTSVVSGDMEAKPLPGNSDVTFSNGEPLAAQAAAAGEVTVDALLAKEQAAAATTLDPNVKKMATARRLSATSFFKRIGKALGAPNLEVVWPDLESESPFREAQMIISAFTQTGVFGVEEIRGPLAQRIRVPIAEGSKAPEGVLQPQTKAALEIAAKVAKDNAVAPSGPGSVDGKQGQSTNVGKLNDGKDGNAARDKGEV